MNNFVHTLCTLNLPEAVRTYTDMRKIFKQQTAVSAEARANGVFLGGTLGYTAER